MGLLAHHWRSQRQDGKADGVSCPAYAPYALVQWLYPRREGGDVVGGLSEDNQELEEHEAGQAQFVLLVLVLLLLLGVHQLLEEEVQDS